MKVLITGAGGFIGSHLVEACVREGMEVRAFVRYNSMNKWGWLDGLDGMNKVEVVTGDIRDYDSVYEAMKGCDTVFHLAALIGIPYSYVSPKAYIETNITGTYNILQAARELEVGNVLVTSTSETYGTAQYVPIDESHPLVGQSPYSATKIAADQLALSYYRSFGLPVKLVRPFNTYGPRQSARAVIPTIITQILAGKQEIMLGNCTPTRDLVFVEDTVQGFLAVSSEDSLVGDVVNVGTNYDISIGDLAYKIAALMGKEIKIIEDGQRIRPENSEVERLLCNNEKIREITDWLPQYTLDEGLQKTIAWLSESSALYKQGIYNV